MAAEKRHVFLQVQGQIPRDKVKGENLKNLQVVGYWGGQWACDRRGTLGNETLKVEAGGFSGWGCGVSRGNFGGLKYPGSLASSLLSPWKGSRAS